jgi:hypothetical protein
LMSYLRNKQMTIDFFHFTFVSMKKMEIWIVDTFLNDIFLNYTWLIREIYLGGLPMSPRGLVNDYLKVT